MNRAAAALSAVMLTAPLHAAAADVVAGAPSRLGVVIYRDPNGGDQGVAMIVETREVDLPAGASTLRFEGVADTLIPQTAAVQGLPAPVDERNFDYDLLSPGALVARSVGEQVRVVRTNPGTGRVSEEVGVLRSAPQGLLFETGAGIEALKCSGLPERLVFDRRPPGLSDRPTLSLRIVAPTAGRHRVVLSYLAAGFDWKANYVAQVSEDGRTLDLSGWLTLTNKTATSFPEAKTEVVAGRLARSDETRAPDVELRTVATDCWPTAPWWRRMTGYAAPPALNIPAPAPPMAMMERGLEEIVLTASRKAAQTELGDYKLYTVPDRSTVAANQTKQVAFLDKEGVAFERIYKVGHAGFDAGELTPALTLRLRNTEAQGLGSALPAGLATVMQTTAGRPMLVGEYRVEDTAVGLPVDLAIAGDRGVTAVMESLREGERTVAGKARRFANLKVTVTNTRSQPAQVEYRQSGYDEGFKLVSEDRRHALRENDPVWTLDLAPGQAASLRYEIEADAD
ncbi:MAG: hypothetical protein B7Y99_05380 [Caulobacterales bacterium 32-69-10]|nr:MAG: hypothetical protein B7Y99_05380 [Caulobacterales bacterium 32-69-10]